MAGDRAVHVLKPARARRNDDRTILSGIQHVIKADCGWKDRPSDDGLPTTVYTRFNG